MRLVPQDSPETGARYHLADLGFADTLVENGWLASNPLSELMETYLDRLVGENAFQDYGTQFPVSVKTMDVKARTPLRVNVPDDIARQRYDAFGKTALWYILSADPDATLYLGFSREVEAEDFYRRCLAGKVDDVLHAGWRVGVGWQDGRLFEGQTSIRLNLASPKARIEEAFGRMKRYVF